MDSNESGDFAMKEIAYWKAKNRELAKALSHAENLYADMLKERNVLQEELFTLNLQYSKLKNYVKSIDLSARACIDTMVTSSNCLTNILQNTSRGLHMDITIMQKKKEPISSNSPSVKTHIVQPMIEGHVIYSPVINLKRLNGMEQMQQVQPNSVNGHGQNLENITSSRPFQHVSNSNSNVQRNSRQSVEEADRFLDNNEAEPPDNDSDPIDDGAEDENPRLDTIQEEHEPSQNITTEAHVGSLSSPSSSSVNLPKNISLLSGVFRDVRVYLSPMQNMSQYLNPHQHVTMKRGGSSRSPRMKKSGSSEGRQCNTNSVGRMQSPRIVSSTSRSMEDHDVPLQSSVSFDNASFSTNLQNSLLSSTKITSPRHAQQSTSRAENMAWLNDTRQEGDAAQDSDDCMSDSESIHNADNSSNPSLRLRSGRKFADKTLSSRSFEGHDSLQRTSALANSSSNKSNLKIEIMQKLGLIPSNTSGETSQSRNDFQTRQSTQSNQSADKSEGDINVTKRTFRKRKKIVTSLRKRSLEKGVVSKSEGSRSHSGKSVKRLSSGSSLQNRLSLNSPLKQKSSGSTKKVQISSPRKKTSSASSSPKVSSPEKQISNKRPKRSETPNAKQNRSPSSPTKGRSRRDRQGINFKEPSLKRKLRRSK